MSSVVSPAVDLLQQIETMLKDPVIGPRVAQRVAAAIEIVLQERLTEAGGVPDVEAYAKLWISAWDEDGAAQRALISLASI